MSVLYETQPGAPYEGTLRNACAGTVHRIYPGKHDQKT